MPNILSTEMFPRLLIRKTGKKNSGFLSGERDDCPRCPERGDFPKDPRSRKAHAISVRLLGQLLFLSLK